MSSYFPIGGHSVTQLPKRNYKYENIHKAPTTQKIKSILQVPNLALSFCSGSGIQKNINKKYGNNVRKIYT